MEYLQGYTIKTYTGKWGKLLLCQAAACTRDIVTDFSTYKNLALICYRTSSYDYETLEVLFDVLKTGENENIPVEKVWLSIYSIVPLTQ